MSSTTIPGTTIPGTTVTGLTTAGTGPTTGAPHGQPTGRRLSRRTAWTLAGSAVVVIAATGGSVAALTTDDAAAPAAAVTTPTWSAGADAEESSHGFGPTTGGALPVPRRAEAGQLVHGTAGGLRDAVGRPLAF